MKASHSNPIIAITGSAGWVGRALAEQLEKNGYSVLKMPHDTAHSTTLPQGTRCLVHLAALVHQMDRQPSANDYHKANCDFAIAMARKAAVAGCAQMIFVSTAKVMGERSAIGVPFTEAHEPQPSDAYSKSKWQAELALSKLVQAGELGQMQICILRPPVVYGPGAGANVKRLEQLAASPWPLPLGRAQAPRSMVSLSLLTNAIESLIETLNEAFMESPTACRDGLPALETFFVADPMDTSVAQIITNLRAAQGRKPGLVNVPAIAMKIGLSVVGQQAIYERLFTPLQIDGSKLRRFLTTASKAKAKRSSSQST